ncbi:Alkaline phosphatase [hydrothermal vent metagenome]|uniref:Alkaline phosphatase n=1 Tax=hydrothermal vent metagenome TaxID=652676 RepID=A0A3B0RDK5_9ZZZZ
MSKAFSKTYILVSVSVLVVSACLSVNQQSSDIVASGSGQQISTKPPVQQTALPQQTTDTYYQAGSAQLSQILQQKAQTGRAKNIILMIGDGMGMSTITAGRIFSGQAQAKDGESYLLEMEKLPYTAIARTYAHDSQVSDSASTATALVSGVKTNIRTLGVDQTVPYADCMAAKGHHVSSIFELAEDAGRATGMVTTARITHATPASVYGHSANRGWEVDSVISAKDREAGCTDLAQQLIEWPNGDGLEIALGGGRANFLPKQQTDPEYAKKTGNRADGRNLAEEWAQKSGQQWIWNQAQFDAIDFSGPQKVLGLFEPSHMNYNGDRAKDGSGEPSLAQMTKAAITRLQQDKDGFVLMVEGARIDMANHGNNAARALEDLMAFDAAVKVARQMTDQRETLIIVTADHSHGLTLNGYPQRGNPILGITKTADGKPMKGADGKAYTTLLYATGPGSSFATPDQYRTIVPGKYSLSSDAEKQNSKPVRRPDPQQTDTTAHNYQQQALIPSRFSMHSGEDVPVYADGPSADLVHGAIEQNTLFHIMAYAGGLAGYEPKD